MNVTQRDPKAINYVQQLISEFGTDLFGFDSDENTLDLDIEQIREVENTDDGLAKMISEEPDKAKFNISHGLAEHSDIDVENVPEVESIRNAPQTTVSGIKADDFHSVRSLTVDINELSSNYSQKTIVEFKCLYCGTKHRLRQNEMTDELSEPHQCTNDECGGSSFNHFAKESVDCQSANIQDILEESTNPHDIEARFFGEDVNRFEAGDRVHITVLVRTYSDDNSSREYPRLKVLYAERDEEKASVEISEDEAEEFESTASEENMLDLLKQSYAPHLEGDEIDPAREGMLLTLFSGHMGTGLRDTVHVGAIGEPSTGKSDLLKIAREVAPHSTFASGGSRITKAGLTAGMERKGKFGDDGWVVRAGTLIKANDGVALVDEVDKMGQELKTALYDPLASQSVNVSMVGHPGKDLKCNPAIAIAANPKNERFRMDKSIGEQLTFPPAFLSRLDLIFTVRDTTKSDRAKARATTEKHKGTIHDDDSLMDYETMRKLIQYAQSEYKPNLSDEATEFLEDKWRSLRQSMLDDAGFKIDTRQLDSLYRISRTYARIRLSDTVEKKDAQRAWDITRRSFDDLNRFGDNDTFDVTMLYNGESTSQAQRREDILSKISELDSSENTFANEELVVDALSDEYERGEVEAEMELLKEKGKVFPMSGELKVSDQSL